MPVSTGGFTQAIRVLSYSRTKTKKTFSFRLRAYHPLGDRFPAASANQIFCNFSHPPLWGGRHLRLTTSPRTARKHQVPIFKLPARTTVRSGGQTNLNNQNLIFENWDLIIVWNLSASWRIGFWNFCAVHSNLGYFRFRSPLLTEFLLVFFPPGTEMFYFPGSTPYRNDRVSRISGMGFPIRTSPDQRLLGTSPKRIAAKLRPSSPFEAKASTIRPCFPLGNLEITCPA